MNSQGSHYILRKGLSSLSDLVDGNGAFGYPGDYPGLIFYVNNITGSTTNDGLSWAFPKAQISQAIAAAEAGRPSVRAGSNDFVRNIIFVQGTSTAYTVLTALPNYCDIIGVGADPRGNGSGIARLTSTTGVNTTDDSITAGVRGLRLYNLQFGGSGTGWGLSCTTLFRSVIENCAFVNKTTGGILLTTGGGNEIRNCHIGGDTSYPAIGLQMGNSGGNANQCLVEDNFIYGSTTGVSVSAYLCDHTVFRNNTIYGGTTGLSDTCTDSTLAANAFYSGNFLLGGSAAYSITNNGAKRCTANRCNSNGTGTVYVTSS